MTTDIYNDEIKRLAAGCVEPSSIESVQATARLSNPFCGDRVRLDISLEGRVVTGFGYEVRGCLLCRAALNRMIQLTSGRSVDRFKMMTLSLERLLKGGGDKLDDESDLLKQQEQALSIFSSVQAHKSRHECVLLPFRTALKAIESLGL